MDIKIIDVTVTEVPKKVGQGTNKQMSCTFENLTFGGKTDGKKLFDWAVPKEVWAALEGAKKGDIFSIETKKNDKGFIDWLSVAAKDAVDYVAEAAAAPARARTPAQTRQAQGEKVSSTWDEKNKLDRERFEFDKEKQALIIRQSSLSTAVAYLALPGCDQPAVVQDVINIAKNFEQYVMTGDAGNDEPK